MNNSFKSKIWMVGLMLVAAQAIYGQEDNEVAPVQPIVHEQPQDTQTNIDANDAVIEQAQANKNMDIAEGLFPETTNDEHPSKAELFENDNQQQSQETIEKTSAIKIKEFFSQEKTEKTLVTKAKEFFTIEKLKSCGQSLLTYARGNKVATAAAVAVPVALIATYNYAKNNDMWIYKKFKDTSTFVKAALAIGISGAIFATPCIIQSLAKTTPAAQ